jgi:hypothetical protein
MRWVNVCQRTIRRRVSTYVYVNNHYAGFAPATVVQFEKLWGAETDAHWFNLGLRDLFVGILPMSLGGARHAASLSVTGSNPVHTSGAQMFHRS